MENSNCGNCMHYENGMCRCELSDYRGRNMIPENCCEEWEGEHGEE